MENLIKVQEIDYFYEHPKEMAIFEGRKGIVCTTDDCLSFVIPNDSSEYTKIKGLFNNTTNKDLKEWIHYFGIKQRIERNYKTLKTCLKEIDCLGNLGGNPRTKKAGRFKRKD